ncbi:MAG: MBL fold metallo-hydrolase [Gemmatimonadetes bacterium]|nr:MBL fold metallo-hydrolase [Gemmatimonadota bacterium]
MRIVALASGSSGNAILVDDGTTRVLVDCGIGPRTLAKGLKAAGVAPESVQAILVTHEHIDHVRGIPQAVAKWGWTVIGTAGTVRRLPTEVRPAAKTVREHVRIGDLDIALVPVSHDAAEPAAYAFTSRTSGQRAGVAHDLGEPSDKLIRAFRGVELLCIEANHDADMLRDGPYPAFLKDRVASATGHLSNAQSAAFIDAVGTAELRAVLLLHLSETNNTPEIACSATKRGVTRLARRATLAAAVRRAPSAPIGRTASGQLALSL